MRNKHVVVSAVLALASCTDPSSSSEEIQTAGSHPAGNLDQCANGPLSAPVPCAEGAWVNGNLNANQAHYIEGNSVPYRLRLSNLATGIPHVVRLEWDTTENGKHALDYITAWNQSEVGDPCAGVAGCSAASYTTFAVPIDPRVAAGPDGVAATADDITQHEGLFTLYGGTLAGASAYTTSGSYEGSSQTSITLTFTASVSNPLLAWGGRIALRADWRPDPTATDIAGSPYHMRLLDLDGRGGNQDRSLAAAAAYNLPNLIVIKHVINDNGSTLTAGDFALTVTGSTPSPAAFAGQEAPGTVVTFAAPGSYSVGEAAVAGYAPSYSAECTGAVGYDETKTCTVTNDDPDRCLGVTCDGESACGDAGVCNPGTGQCDYAPKPSTTVCRPAASDCDVAETCDGASLACPADGFASAETLCRAAAGTCDVTETCTGTSATCPTDAKSTAVCRGSAGACDTSEICDGVSNDCPGDAYVSGIVCRAEAGPCDVPEVCTGAGPACPADGFASTATECRATAGVCDVAELCTGAGAACPADAKSTATCRAADGACDVAEVCDGTNNACPSDGFRDPATECRVASGVCDVAENCTGWSGACPADSFAPPTDVCREANGECDIAESCTGLSSTCPGDGFASSVTSCRAAADICDIGESCTGWSATCPADGFAPGTETCRSAAGVCDIAEQCTGTQAACPDDAYASSGTTCRSAGGSCDVAEQCTGAGVDCPGDALVVAGTECRASTNSCDPGETCSGSTANCPIDVAGICTVCGDKFYDADADGSYDADELGIAGWRFELTGATNATAVTDGGGGFLFTGVAAGDYSVCETRPLETTWMQTTPAGCFIVHVPSAEAESCSLDFGNLCLGWGGGHTIGYWSNANGKHSFMATDSGASAFALLVSLNLVDNSGTAFDPASYPVFATWLTNSYATNMAYMLSAQLAGMELNVQKGLVDGSDLIYAPGTVSASALGFATVEAVMTEANTELGLHAVTFDGSPYRAYQERLKNALDRANNNLNFVQPGACSFTFGPAL